MNLKAILDEEKEFRVIRSGVAFPHESVPGCFLVGGVNKDTDSIKVLGELEFGELGKVFESLNGLCHWNYCYCRNVPENEPYVDFFQKKSLYLRLAQSTEHIAFGVNLINEYLINDHLQIPKGGILEKQLQSNLDIFESCENLHGINALFALLCGLDTEEPFPEWCFF